MTYPITYFVFNAFIRADFTNEAFENAETEKSRQATVAKVGAYAVSFILSCVTYSALFCLGYGMSALALGKDVALAGVLLSSPNPLMLIVGGLFTLIGVTYMGIYNKPLQTTEEIEKLIENAEMIIQYQPSFIYSIPKLIYQDGKTQKEILELFDEMVKDTAEVLVEVNAALGQNDLPKKKELENIKKSLESLKKTQNKNRGPIESNIKKIFKLREEPKWEFKPVKMESKAMQQEGPPTNTELLIKLGHSKEGSSLASNSEDD